MNQTIGQKLKRVVRWEKKHRLIPHLVVACLFAFLLAKSIFRTNDVDLLLFVYGVSVTLVILMQMIVAFYFYKDPYVLAMAEKKAKKKKAKKPFVSCLVAVYNEEIIIRKCVESICNQTYEKKEIIFVNDNSSDNTGKILDSLAKEFPIKVLHNKSNIGKKRALGRAMRISKGELIAFTDSDSLWHHDAIEKIVEIFMCFPDVGAVSGHTRALNGSKNFLTKVQDAWYEGQFSVRKAFESTFGAVTCVSGPLAVFRRDSIYNFIPAWEQDSFLGQEFRFATDRTLTGFVLGAPYIGSRVKAKYNSDDFNKPDYELKKYRVVYSKSARALTEVPDNLRTIIKQQVRWKKSFIRNTFFTGEFYWRKPFLPALVYYLHIIFVFTGPLIVLRHLVILPLQGNTYSAFLYLAGILFVGYMFGLAYKLENPESRRWVYRPFMSLLSTFLLSWLIFYSIFTIKKMRWHRG